ncbi:AP complex subunit beta, partial [Kipferlia bialata]
ANEWGQVSILEALVTHTPASADDALSACERIAPRLQHANAAVVLSAVRAMCHLVEFVEEGDKPAMLRKLCPPLVTLLSGDPEVQYVALRNIELILQKYPALLANNVKVFFV